jgi:hypothetical protein
MRKFIYLLALLCIVNTGFSQKSFEKKMAEIGDQIQMISEQEKEVLRIKVDEINTKLDKKLISKQEAENQKLDAAEKCANRIEQKVAPLEREIQNLVKVKAEGNWESDNEEEMDHFSDDDNDDDEVKISSDDDGQFNFSWNPKKRKKREYKGEPRTTSQFVFAVGLNNLITEGDLSSLDNNGIKFGTSRFYEWGLTYKTRLLNNSNFLQLKYGLSLMYNNLRPNDNRYFVPNNGMTTLEKYPENLTDEPYLRNIALVIPLHIEFDFGKKKMKEDRVILRSQKSVRVGFGGYAGIRTRTKQLLEYKVDGYKTESVTKGNYNANDFVYGTSAYIGYKDMSFYTKYDLNPLFKNNLVDQNNISFGLRFDFN